MSTQPADKTGPHGLSKEKTDEYKTTLSVIQKYFGVTEPCALYLYHRSFRSRRKDDKYMPWSLNLQNALVKADKCLGLDWLSLNFDGEEKELEKHGLVLEEMDSNTVFRWVDDAEDGKRDEKQSDGWAIVSRKKKKTSRFHGSYDRITKSGLIVS